MAVSSLSFGDREYVGIQEVQGPLFVIEGIHDVGYNELVEIVDDSGLRKLGITLEVAKGKAVVQVFGTTGGLSLAGSRVKFKGRPFELGVGSGMLGRIFNGLGAPIDEMPAPVPEKISDVNGLPINPTARDYPRKFIQTGISSIDIMTTLVRGQKLPIFSGNGLPHDILSAQIARQAKIIGETQGFAVVFAAMGVKHDVARFFIDSFQESGALADAAVFLSLADAPSIERIITPRVALTCAEFLAFEKGMHILVIMTDMGNYCEALREISTLRGEIPARKGYPGYLYSDLSSLYERAGLIKGREGSITQMPILTMPNDDITHPVPDLTGYITEGQVVLERELSQKGVYPPIAGLPSLSRLMKDNIGSGLTRDDHPHLASQLFACYARVKDVRALSLVIGREELSALDRQYLEFGDVFEKQFLSQGEQEERSLEQSLGLGWKILTLLPKEELHRISADETAQYYGK
ncbi:MAG: V-type ATP synthase subunit B [Candidatus Omnitrophica bacterium]|nr:V-type ATP synthase subunit B [Candidatus Omnitrophota bacterium]MDE2222858.1 V-type ATP synthase subunit B [Candidatus Omnitrophota bacterium]